MRIHEILKSKYLHGSQRGFGAIVGRPSNEKSIPHRVATIGHSLVLSSTDLDLGNARISEGSISAIS
jgi:hypothetical protein